ncbi:hypothetical protein BJX64DRAFT_12830 [Aspergillus heterothallicus]
MTFSLLPYYKPRSMILSPLNVPFPSTFLFRKTHDTELFPWPRCDAFIRANQSTVLGQSLNTSPWLQTKIPAFRSAFHPPPPPPGVILVSLFSLLRTLTYLYLFPLTQQLLSIPGHSVSGTCYEALSPLFVIFEILLLSVSALHLTSDKGDNLSTLCYRLCAPKVCDYLPTSRNAWLVSLYFDL